VGLCYAKGRIHEFPVVTLSLQTTVREQATMNIFRQLRWKLTLSYTLVTVGALLVITLVLGGILMIRIFEAESYHPPGYDPEGYMAGFMDLENSTSSYLYYCQVLSQTPQDLKLVNRMLTKLQSEFARY
jgi:hypothetical protein